MPATCSSTSGPRRQQQRRGGLELVPVWRALARPRTATGALTGCWPHGPAGRRGDMAVGAAPQRAVPASGPRGEAGGDFASLKEFVTAYRETDPDLGQRFPVRDALIRSHQYLVARARRRRLSHRHPEICGTGLRSAVRQRHARVRSVHRQERTSSRFGEVYDEEEKIARFIGRQASPTQT